VKLAEQLGDRQMTHDAVTHDVVLALGDGPKRKFRIYGRPMPGSGDIIALPVDGRLINARVIVHSEKLRMEVDAELVE
jgi:hypothetical protein